MCYIFSLQSSHHHSLYHHGPGPDCHRVSAWSQFLHHSSGNTGTSQPRIPRNHPRNLQVNFSLSMYLCKFWIPESFVTRISKAFYRLTLLSVANPGLEWFALTLFSTPVTVPHSVLSSATTALGTPRPFRPGFPRSITYK